VNLLTTGSEHDASQSRSVRAGTLVKTNGNSKPLNRGKILVVEDNPTNQRVATLQLAELGYASQAVYNGQEALEEMSRNDYDLVFMDCQMPDMDGFEATKQIRRQEALTGRHVPIVAMTAHAMSEDKYRCLNAGMDDYVSKPVRPRRLQSILDRFLPLPDSERDDSKATAERNNEARQETGAPVDVDTLRAELGEEESGEVYKMFVKSTDALLAKLNAAVAGKDMPQLQRALHELKGVSESVGATELAKLARTAEQELNQGDWSKVQQSPASMRAAFDRAHNFLSTNSLV
ncbi:MAG TPA: response regulator, partial [Chroococcales cyanobacterium]